MVKALTEPDHSVGRKQSLFVETNFWADYKNRGQPTGEKIRGFYVSGGRSLS